MGFNVGEIIVNVEHEAVNYQVCEVWVPLACGENVPATKGSTAPVVRRLLTQSGHLDHRV